ncbi:hypothetical protein DFP72DRAFT_1166918 [Ephemerocybe angulata]|uniref:Uncharacterized protein n=1 Tax=Ephemerocybe angulata TaxID=980116 RepID=A0A8H6I8Z2_9AGAR|nr:hypothetical protein DFP72DRAFT_1166918 [Tulosesus angulatus]
MQFVLALAMTLFAVSGSLAAPPTPSTSLREVPCGDWRLDGPVCPSGWTCCFTTAPEFANGVSNMQIITILVSAVALLSLQAAGAPSSSLTEEEVYHCANGKDKCPPGWTCCGPIRQDVGGICIKLEAGQACIF